MLQHLMWKRKYWHLSKKKKKDLASLKSGVDEADIDKLKTAFANLSYLQNLAQRCEN